MGPWLHSVGRGSRVAVAVVPAGSCSSDSTPSLGTSVCPGCGPKRENFFKRQAEGVRGVYSGKASQGPARPVSSLHQPGPAPPAAREPWTVEGGGWVGARPPFPLVRCKPLPRSRPDFFCFWAWPACLPFSQEVYPIADKLSQSPPPVSAPPFRAGPSGCPDLQPRPAVPLGEVWEEHQPHPGDDSLPVASLVPTAGSPTLLVLPVWLLKAENSLPHRERS